MFPSVGAIVIFLSTLSRVVLALPPVSTKLYRRNDNSSSTIIKTTVLAPNGTDISSSFRTMVYSHPSKTVPYNPKVIPNSNITSWKDTQDLNPRGSLSISMLGRPLGGNGFCRSPTGEFQHSVCKSSLGIAASPRDYFIYCQETVVEPETTPTSRASRMRPQQSLLPPPRPRTGNRGGIASTSYEPHNPPVLAESGACWQDEICVDGIFTERGYPMLASCVLEEDYVENDDDGTIDGIEGKAARITVTALDKNAPAKLRQLSVETAKRGSGGAGSSSLETINECVDCSQLKTDAFEPDINFLKVEASAMMTGAMAGVIWLTFG